MKPDDKWEHSAYDDAFEAIKLMAKTKMVLNYHKGDIANCSSTDLIEMVKGEVIELDNAVQDEEIVHVIEEAADVLNFLVALTHQQIKKYRSRK